MAAQVQNQNRGVFGSYFTPSNEPQTLQKTALLTTLCIATRVGVEVLPENHIISNVVLTPICEELLFGGFCSKILDISLNAFQGKPKTQAQQKTRSDVRAVTIAAFFALNHSNQLVGNFVHFWFLGRASGYSREETGGFAIPIALHMLHNGIHATKESFEPGSFSSLVPIATTMTIHILTLNALGKNIYPWTSIKETYRYFTTPTAPQAKTAPEAVLKKIQQIEAKAKSVH